MSTLLDIYLHLGLFWAIYWQLERAHAGNLQRQIILYAALNLLFWPVMAWKDSK